MDSEALIAQLSADLPPVRRRATGEMLLAGLAMGAVVALAFIVIRLGLRADLAQAAQGGTFWMKLAYTATLALIAGLACVPLARPDRAIPRRLWLLAVPVAALAAIALTELIRMPTAAWPALWLGASWRACSALVLGLAAPLFAGLAWAMRQLAPTRLRATGAVAGLAAGAAAATLYCLHCPETSALFVLCWYSLGIALATGAGALLGPRLLRW